MVQATDSGLSKKLALCALTAVMISIWLLLAMVFADRFFPPFDSLELRLMPWKAMVPLEADLNQRLSLMQAQVDRSNVVAHYAFVVMIISFSALTMYLSVIYQQKQRRARENMLLLLKNQEIARRNEFIRYISATIGHEFKNNLGRVKRRIDLLPDLPADARERIEDNLDKLFADIDIFKKISDKREAGLIEFKNIDIKALLGSLTAQYTDLADIQVLEGADVPVIYAAPPLLNSVFENLVDNAIKYKKPDQPHAHLRISFTMDKDGSRQYVTITFRDEGVGMDEQQADQCFYKGRTTGEGWGQGLYYAKYVIGLHAGKIRVGKEYTAPGIGAEIIINLPYVEEMVDV